MSLASLVLTNNKRDVTDDGVNNVATLMNQPIIIVGAGWAGQTIAAVLAQKSPNCVLGFVDDEPHSNPVVIPNNSGGMIIPVLGHSRDLVSIAKSHHAKAVVVAVTNDREDHFLSQLIKCYEQSIPVYEMPELYAQLTGKFPVQHINHRWITPDLTRPKTGFYALFHNATNYLLSLIGCVFAFIPILPFMALAIKLDSKGPVFFRQVRIGKRGIPFTLLKFRTMVEDASKSGAAWTEKNDGRITRVGSFLRKFRLDELPQLINILRGEMALIGPRPEARELVELFQHEIPFYEYRYLVLPGLTGWAQVNYENTCSVEGALEKLQYDLYWIKHRSFWLDLKIIFKSIKVMLTGFGAV